MEEALTALLKPVASGRRWWLRAPQNVAAKDGPYVVLTRIDGQRDYHGQGPSGYVQSRVQVDVYAESYTALRGASRLLIATVSGHRADPIQAVFVDGERDLPAGDAAEKKLFRTSIDLVIHHRE